MPGPLSDTLISMRSGASSLFAAILNPSRGLTRSADRLDRIAHEIEHHLLQLDAVAMHRRQIVGRIQLDGDGMRRGVRAYQHQRLVEHAAHVEGADVRTPAPQEIAHVADHAAGMIDVRDQGRQVVGGPREVGRRASPEYAARIGRAPGRPSWAG